MIALMSCFRAEMIKLRHSLMIHAFFLLPLVPAIMGTMNYQMNLNILTHEWFSLWSQHSLFMCYFFLPPLIATWCAWLLTIEHSGSNWSWVLSLPIRRFHVWLAKFFVVVIIVMLLQVWIGLLFYLSGKVAGLRSEFPKAVLLWLLIGTFGAFPIATIQLFLSMAIRNFAAPIGLAAIGGFTALIARLKGIYLYHPYTLLAEGMNANNPTAQVLLPNTLQLITSALVFMLLSGFVSRLWINRMEAGAGE